MSGTRAKTLRAHYVAAIKGVTLDQRAGEGDRFQHLDVVVRPVSARERSFRAFFSILPHIDDTDSGAAYRLELTAELYYALSPGVEDRAADDSERFWWGLETLLDPANNNELRDAGVMLSSPAWLGVEVTERLYIPRVSLVARYRLDDTLIG